MITVSTVVELDLSCTAPRARINAKQGDGGTRQIVARFTNGSGIISDLSTVTSAELKILRPDGVTVKAAAALSDGAATATLTAEMLAVAGRAFGDMVLYGEGESISAARFDINIMAAADSGIAPDPTPEPQDSGKPALASAVAEGVVGAVGTAEMVYGMDIDLMGKNWEQGSIYDNGDNFNSTARIRMPDYLDISNASDIFYSGFTVTASADKKLQYTFVFFDAEKKILKTSTNKDWLDSGALTTCGTASAPSYVRVVLRHADNSDMTPDVLTSARLKILA
mgnify:FL=1|jgi:hypothetical protein|nr:MAG TPA: BppU domain protein [Caudoviricetes sp.]